jgi:pre-rRNA-processing protein TSR2
MDEFRAGVTASLRSWSALRTAAESGWGGGESLQKADDLRSSIFEHFNGEAVPPKTMVDVTDLEDALAIFMEEEFSVVLDDGSERQVADVIWKMYEACARGDLTMASHVVSVAEQAAAKLHGFPVKVMTPESIGDDEDDDDDENGDHEDAMETVEDASSQDIDASTSPQNAPMAQVAAFEFPSIATTTAAEYASQPLFGQPKKSKKPATEQPPPRQLGEAAPIAEPMVPLDEEGFAPIVKQKRKTRQPV